MKTITIPTNCNPYVVVINNHVYTYKAGETVEVPDEVAEAIEDAIELVPKPKRYPSRFSQLVERTISEVDESDWEGMRTIASFSFADCNSIKKFTIPNGINSIKTSAFYSCSNLESVEIGNGVTSIEMTAFDWCVKLAKVYLPEIPPTLADINAFQNIDTACVFFCKTQASLEAYKKAEKWSTLSGTYTFTLEP